MALVIKPPTPPDDSDSDTIRLAPSKATEEQSRYLERERSELDRKEKILQMKEDAYKKELEYLDSIRRKLDEELRDRRHSVEVIEKALGERQQVLWEKERMLEEKERLLKRQERSGQSALDNEIRELKAKKAQLETQLGKKQAADESKKGDMEIINKALLIKEEILQEKENCLTKYEAEIRERQIKPCEEIAGIEQRRLDLDRDLQEHMERLNQSHATVEEREKEIAQIQKDLLEKEQDLKKEGAAIQQLKTLLGQKEKHLQSKEKMLSEPSARNEEIGTHLRVLEQKKAIFDEELPISLEKLTKIREEWQIKESLFRDKTARMLTDKKEIGSILEKLEDNVKLLDQKEKEIVKVVDELEKDRKLLILQEQKIVLKVQKLQAAEKSLKERENRISDIERALAREEAAMKKQIEYIDSAKDFKKEVPALRKVHAKLQREMQRINDEALAKRELLKSEETRLKSYDAQLSQRESVIQLKEKELGQEEHSLTAHMEEEPGALRSYITQESKGYSGISVMISRAKEHIAAHRIDEAYKVISQAEAEVQRMEESTRRQFVYEILELKTDAKLASLT